LLQLLSLPLLVVPKLLEFKRPDVPNKLPGPLDKGLKFRFWDVSLSIEGKGVQIFGLKKYSPI
jgi:hypothetical protein